MVNLHDLKQQYREALDAAEAILGGPDKMMTKSENEAYEAKMAEASHIMMNIKASEKRNTVRGMFKNGTPFASGLSHNASEPIGFMQTIATAPDFAGTQTPEYKQALMSFLKTGGKAHGTDLVVGADGNGGYHLPGSELFTRQRGPSGAFLPSGMNAALYEGPNGSSDAAGGYALNIPTIQQIVPLGLPDMGIYDAATVIPTATPIKIPTQTAFGTSAGKAESTGTTSTFGGTDFTLGQVELDAYMAGRVAIASWELLQDVDIFQKFIVQDLLNSQRIYEANLFANGTGTGQAQGIFGNTGTGTGSAYELTGAATDSQLLLNSLFDVTSTLKAAYQPNASWTMSRATGLTIRRAQMQANLFAPVWTEGADGTQLLLGRPVYYDQNAPALPTATSAGVLPILYGDFKRAYYIGVRGGAGINVKILDQPLALQGQLALLAYRRVDGRVVMPEAVQQIKISHS
jgi:HK97 family phage major capsid protein